MYDFPRYTLIFFMQHKNETHFLFQSFYFYVATQINKRIKILRSDNGLEFDMKDFYNFKGILHEMRYLDTPQQNDMVERKHRNLLNVTRALCFQAGLPIKFFGECVLTITYLINHSSTPLLSGKTPYEFLFNSIPLFSHLKVFGCLCFAANTSGSKTKFDSKTSRYIFLGYPHDQKEYKLFYLETTRIFVSQNV